MSLTGLFRPASPPVPRPAGLISDYTASNQSLTEFAHPIEVTRDRGGEIRAWLCLGRDEFGTQVTYAATDPKALLALAKAALLLWAQMLRARHGRHAVMRGQK